MPLEIFHCCKCTKVEKAIWLHLIDIKIDHQKCAVNKRWTSGEASKNNFEELSNDIFCRKVSVPSLQGLSDDD